MNWKQVKLIFLREVRDQLRDRRTLFMIAVLPLLLYPLLGMSFLRMSQFLREHSVKTLLVGQEQLAGLPPLVEGEHFAADLFKEPRRARMFTVKTAPHKTGASADDEAAAARAAAESGEADVAVYFPPRFAEHLREEYPRNPGPDAAPPANESRPTEPRKPADAAVPEVRLFWNEAKEESRLAQRGVSELLERWREEVIRQSLVANRIPETLVRPFDLASTDVAAAGQDKAALWSRILPFVLLLWALTGAFYPAVDLCAGEKERGTLETLLCSPAERREIVWGKLLTIMVFSMATAILNLLSLGITGSLLLSQLETLGPPPLVAVVWLLVALPPVSALFSALCLSIAVFARSTKEGQYYLMPLVLITLPLTMLPMAPGVELTLGNSLIPISGFVLLLRTVLEGNYAAAAPLVAPVALVTLACCQFSIRWATEQFNRESVLFRESERLDLGLWLKQLMRTRQDTPSTPEAILCGTLILLLEFFMSLSLPKIANLAELAVVTQLVVIATPALIMTVMLTRSPVKTLLLVWPGPRALLAAALLAVAIHPVNDALGALVQRVYPVSDPVAEQFKQLTEGMTAPWILLLWLVPPVCEELAFRGFILSGMRHSGHKWRAIVVSSLFFGASHMLLQQSLLATVMGLVLGYLAIQTGSIGPSIVFHLSHNGLSLLVGSLDPAAVDKHPALVWLGSWNNPAAAAFGHALCALLESIAWLRAGSAETGLEYRLPVAAVGALAAAALLLWLRKLPYARTPEEAQHELLEARSRAMGG